MAPVVDPEILAGPFFVSAALLAAAGFTKFRQPAPLARTLAAAGAPSGRPLVRLIGAAELAAGATALVYPRPAVSLAVALLFLSFAVFLTYLIVGKVPVSSCGCLGERDTPPSVLHILLNLAAAVVAGLVAVSPLPALVSYLFDLSYLAIPFVLGGIASAYLAYLITAFLPSVFFAHQERSGSILVTSGSQQRS